MLDASVVRIQEVYKQSLTNLALADACGDDIPGAIGVCLHCDRHIDTVSGSQLRKCALCLQTSHLRSCELDSLSKLRNYVSVLSLTVSVNLIARCCELRWETLQGWSFDPPGDLSKSLPSHVKHNYKACLCHLCCHLIVSELSGSPGD